MVLFVALLMDAILIQNIVRKGYPLESPIFWVSVTLEIAMAYLAYFFWIRSMAGQEFRNYRFWAILILAFSLAWPFILTYSLAANRILNLADRTGHFFFAAILSLASYYLFKGNYSRLFELFRRK